MRYPKKHSKGIAYSEFNKRAAELHEKQEKLKYILTALCVSLVAEQEEYVNLCIERVKSLLEAKAMLLATAQRIEKQNRPQKEKDKWMKKIKEEITLLDEERENIMKGLE